MTLWVVPRSYIKNTYINSFEGIYAIIKDFADFMISELYDEKKLL